MIEIDECHRQLIGGLVRSHKPTAILELGIGTGLTTAVLLEAIEFNQRGKLTCVDNLFDWEGRMPPHVCELTAEGVEIIVSNESDYMHTCATDVFDFIVSDADHQRADQHIAEYLRVARDGAILVFHDTNEGYPNLRSIPLALAEFPCVQFNTSSRPDELCERGFTVIFNVRK